MDLFLHSYEGAFILLISRNDISNPRKLSPADSVTKTIIIYVGVGVFLMSCCRKFVRAINKLRGGSVSFGCFRAGLSDNDTSNMFIEVK